MENKELEICVLSAPDIALPQYATEGSSGADVMANVATPLTVESGKMALVPTGLFLEIPPGYEVQVRPRSGLAFKSQITVLNTPGTIDSDYRGEIKVLLINHGSTDFVVTKGMKIAQLVVAPVLQARFVRVEALEASGRGSGGFGSTGV